MIRARSTVVGESMLAHQGECMLAHEGECMLAHEQITTVL